MRKGNELLRDVRQMNRHKLSKSFGRNEPTPWLTKFRYVFAPDF